MRKSKAQRQNDTPQPKQLKSKNIKSKSRVITLRRKLFSTIVVPGQAPFLSKLSAQQKIEQVQKLHDTPTSPETLNPDPCQQFLQWFKDVASVEPIMPERMTVSTIRRVKGNDGKETMYPSSRPLLLKEILVGEQMVSPYTLLTPPESGSAPTTAASIAKQSNQCTVSHFFPLKGQDVMTGTSVPYPHSISNSIVNAGGAFTFVTNYMSDKSRQVESFCFEDDQEQYNEEHLVNGGGASLTFHWVELERVVRIEGKMYRAPEALSDLYHTQRPRASRVSALASHQSSFLRSHQDLVDRYNQIDLLLKEGRYGEIDTVGVNRVGKKPLVPAKLSNGEIDPDWVPRPDQWGAFVIVPERFEFWQGKPSRFHERVVYTPKGNTTVANSNNKIEWDLTLLQP